MCKKSFVSVVHAKMEETRDVTFFEICRLCLDNRGYCDIFDKNEIIEDIYKCTGIKISLEDNLPQKICEKCLNIVNKAKELRIVATKNDAHLKSIFFNADIQSSKGVRDKTRVELKTVKPNDTVQKHPVIVSYLRVRNDLFESSVQHESVTEVKSPDPDSSLDSAPVKIKIDRDLDTYTCEICSKVFNKWKKFYLHKRLHVKNVTCPRSGCNKKFSTKGDMIKHVRTHTGEKPYVCDICYKGFAQRITMKKHKETVHSDDASADVDPAEVS